MSGIWFLNPKGIVVPFVEVMIPDLNGAPIIIMKLEFFEGFFVNTVIHCVPKGIQPKYCIKQRFTWKMVRQKFLGGGNL